MKKPIIIIVILIVAGAIVLYLNLSQDNKNTNTNEDWRVSLIPEKFEMTQINSDYFNFTENNEWNDNENSPIIINDNDSHCARGTTYLNEEVKKQKVTNDESYFYCSVILKYDPDNNTGKRFSIWKLVLKETTTSNMFEVVDYKFLEEDY